MIPSVCVIFGLVLPGPTTQAELLQPALRWPALEATVRVVATEKLGAGSGSAVCIGYREPWAYFLTANHVIPDDRGFAIDLFQRAHYPKAVNRLDGATIIARSSAADLAIFKVVMLASQTPASLPLAAPGQRPKRFPVEAVAFGCPAGAPPEARSQLILAKKFVRQAQAPGSAAYFWQVQKQPVGGLSGGPLVDQHGRVIGICVAHQDGKGYFTHTDEILALLRDHSLGWLFEPNRSAPVDPMP